MNELKPIYPTTGTGPGSDPEQEGSLDDDPGSSKTHKPTGFWKTILAYLGLSRPAMPGVHEENDTDQMVPQHLTAEEKSLLNNVLRMKTVRVSEVMTPRAEIVAIDLNATLGQTLQAFEDDSHSRMPVYRENLDEPVGMVHIRDVVGYMIKQSRLAPPTKKPSTPATPCLDLTKVPLTNSIGDLKLYREVLFVPPSMLASNLMEKMQAKRIQMALVIDEHGGTDGLVSLEDLVEVIFGEIEDEHDDQEEEQIIEKADGTLVCDARAELELLSEKLSFDFQHTENNEDVDTIGGLIFAHIGRVPVRGEVINAFGFEFRVVDADPRRIRKLEITRKPSPGSLKRLGP